MPVAEQFAWYAVPLAVAMLVYSAFRRRIEHKSLAIRQEAMEAGLNEPATLHPVIDPLKCIGCRSCTIACPEGDVIGILRGKAELIAPSECIGHGACHAACPVGAITLVFGTATRGVDLPLVGPDFQTSVPGVFIAGELGGMGLIRNAIEQGRQAVDYIGGLNGLRKGGIDLVIVGAGPAGLSATLAAKEKKLNYVTIEQDSFGGTVAHYPRGKLVMTAPANLPLWGKVSFREISREALLAFWQQVVKKTGVKISYGEQVESVRLGTNGLEVQTTRTAYKTRAVLLAIGRRGTPRKLGVPGEELPKVIYRLADTEQFRGRRVLVVGGGDSALEAASVLACEGEAEVTLAYRGDAFGRAKLKNRQNVEELRASKRLAVYLNTNVTRITENQVDLDCEGKPLCLANDDVIVCAGGILPTMFLKSIGIEIETKYGTA